MHFFTVVTTVSCPASGGELNRRRRLRQRSDPDRERIHGTAARDDRRSRLFDRGCRRGVLDEHAVGCPRDKLVGGAQGIALLLVSTRLEVAPIVLRRSLRSLGDLLYKVADAQLLMPGTSVFSIRVTQPLVVPESSEAPVHFLPAATVTRLRRPVIDHGATEA